MDRPFSERARRRAFALAAAVLVLAAVVLTLTADRPEPGAGAARAAEAPPRAREPGTSAPPTPRPVLYVGRRFVAGYLAYLYGRGSASAIPAGSVRLRDRLARHRPRLSPQLRRQLRRRHPRIVSAHAASLPGRAGWRVTATVTDGGTEPYPVEVAVERRAGRLVVARLMGER